MYNQGYEDYMRNVLGYNPRSEVSNAYQTDSTYVYQPTYTQVSPMNYGDNSFYLNTSAFSTEELEKMYPDIYYLINPMVCKRCSQLTGALTENILNSMVDEIYNAIEVDEIRQDETRKVELKNGDVKNPNAKENRGEDRIQRRPNNYLLRDLIRILILNNLLGGRPPVRPRPPMHPRPPFPGNRSINPYSSMSNIPPVRPGYSDRPNTEVMQNPYAGY